MESSGTMSAHITTHLLIWPSFYEVKTMPWYNKDILMEAGWCTVADVHRINRWCCYRIWSITVYRRKTCRNVYNGEAQVDCLLNEYLYGNTVDRIREKGKQYFVDRIFFCSNNNRILLVVLLLCLLSQCWNQMECLDNERLKRTYSTVTYRIWLVQFRLFSIH